MEDQPLPVYARKLQDLCVDTLVDALKKGNNSCLKAALPKNLVNKVFKAITDSDVEITSENINLLHNMFKKVTKVTWGPSFHKYNSCLLLSNLNPFELSLPKIREGLNELIETRELVDKQNQGVVEDEEYSDDSDDESLGMDGMEEDPVIFDPVLWLNALLNKSTRDNLQKLAINGEELEFLDGWIESLSKTLPSLTKLHIPHCTLKRNEFLSICNNMKNLQELDMSYTNTSFTSLQGIRNLSNLKTLRIAALHICSQADMAEIFELNQLETLDISQRILKFSGARGVRPPLVSQIKIFMQMVAQGRVLPALKYLEISRTRARQDQVETFLNNHPNLELMGLVDIEIQRGFVVPGSRIKLLTDGSVSECIDALDFYLECNDIHQLTIETLLEKMAEKVEENYDSLDEPELVNVFQTVIRVMKKFPKDAQMLRIAGQCAWKLFSDERHAMFTIQELHMYVKCLEFPGFEKYPISYGHMEFVDSWRLFMLHGRPSVSIWRVRKLDLLDYDLLCDRAVKFVQHVIKVGAELSQTREPIRPAETALFECAMTVLASYLGKTSDAKYNQLFDNENWKRMILTAGRAKKIRHPGIYMLWLEVVEKLSTRRVTESIDMAELIIEAVVENVGIFNHNYRTQPRTLRMLERVAPFLRVESLKKIFQKNLIEILGEILHNRTYNNQKEVASMLSTVYFLCNPELSVDNKESLVASILRSLRGYQVENGEDAKRVYMRVIARGRYPNAQHFGKWVVRQITEMETESAANVVIVLD